MLVSEFINMLEVLKRQHGDLVVLDSELRNPPAARFFNKYGVTAIVVGGPRIDTPDPKSSLEVE